MRSSRYGRPRAARRMLFTRRDGQILSYVLKMGPVRRDHLQRLFFTPGAASRCQRRLTLLYQNRYLDKLAGQPVNAPDVYFISRRCTRASTTSRLTWERRRWRAGSVPPVGSPTVSW